MLNAPTNQRCLLVSENDGTTWTTRQVCKAHHKLCTTIESNNNNECTNNIPENREQKCDWIGTPASCQPVSRNCNDADLYYKSKTICSTLAISEPDKDTKKCIYKGGNCILEKYSCVDRNIGYKSDCEHYTPLKDNDYDYAKICTYDETNKPGLKCKERQRKCDEYVSYANNIPTNLLNEDLIGQL